MVDRRAILSVAAAIAILAAAYSSSAATSAGINWQPSFEEAKLLAAQSNRLILVHFWAPSCKECKKLDKDVFSQATVQQSINARFVPVKLNTDEYPTTAKLYGVDRLPTDLIITPAGQIVGRMKCPPTAKEYVDQLNIAASGSGPAAAPGLANNPFSQMQSAAPQSAYPAQQTAGVYPTTTPGAYQSPIAPATAPPAYPTTATPASQFTAPLSYPTMTAPGYPSTATPAYPTTATPAYPTTATPAYPYTAAASPAMTPAQPQTAPAMPNYSDQRYAEYYQRFGAQPAAGQPAQPAANQYSQPNYTQPAYNQPAYNQLAQPAAGQLAGSYPSTPYSPATSAPGAIGWPSNASNMSALVHNSSPTMPAPSASITGVAAAPQAQSPIIAPAASQFGLDGYCPVTLSEQKRWQVGDRRWGAMHRGKTYLFAGPAEQQKFMTNPDRYAPAISGEDVVVAVDQGQSIPGKREFGVEYQGRTYLFASPASRQIFCQNYARYAGEVLQAENARPPLR
jgi:YHS domain-containing protein/thiol-disulfide isomerase/thioredoxin